MFSNLYVLFPKNHDEFCRFQSHDEFADFHTKFDLLLSNINHEFPLCSVVIEDLNARCSRSWQNDITNSIGQEIDSLTLSTGYKQMNDKPTHVINNSMSCIDLLFFLTKMQFQIMKLMSQSLINVTIILSLVRLTSLYHCLQYMSMKSGIRVRQMIKSSRKGQKYCFLMCLKL